MELEQALKIQDSHVYERYYVASLGLKSGRAQYEEGQRSREDAKNKKNRENRSGKKGGGGYRGNKINPVVRKSNGSEASVYYHIIYWCYQGLIVLG